jgi:RNA polymerase sigma factor (sigma-70 family)
MSLAQGGIDSPTLVPMTCVPLPCATPLASSDVKRLAATTARSEAGRPDASAAAARPARLATAGELPHNARRPSSRRAIATTRRHVAPGADRTLPSRLDWPPRPRRAGLIGYAMLSIDEHGPCPAATADAARGERRTVWRGIDLGWAYSLLPAIARRTTCVERARDVLHEALLRHALRHGNAIEQPHAYLRRTIDTVLIDHRRDATRYLPLPIGEDELPGSAVAASAQQVAELRERLHLIERALAALPPRAREVFWLFRIEGRRQQEIASLLGISRNMVERHVIRAMTGLRVIQRGMGAP